MGFLEKCANIPPKQPRRPFWATIGKMAKTTHFLPFWPISAPKRTRIPRNYFVTPTKRPASKTLPPSRHSRYPKFFFSQHYPALCTLGEKILPQRGSGAKDAEFSPPSNAQLSAPSATPRPLRCPQSIRQPTRKDQSRFPRQMATIRG